MEELENKIRLWKEKVFSSTDEEELSRIKEEMERTYLKLKDEKFVDEIENLLFTVSNKLKEIHTCDPFKLRKAMH